MVSACFISDRMIHSDLTSTSFHVLHKPTLQTLLCCVVMKVVILLQMLKQQPPYNSCLSRVPVLAGTPVISSCIC